MIDAQALATILMIAAHMEPEGDEMKELEGYENEPLYCRECKTIHLGKEWCEAEVPCEDCGDHPAIQCPCGERYDMIYNDMEDFTNGP